MQSGKNISAEWGRRNQKGGIVHSDITYCYQCLRKIGARVYCFTNTAQSISLLFCSKRCKQAYVEGDTREDVNGCIQIQRIDDTHYLYQCLTCHHQFQRNYKSAVNCPQCQAKWANELKAFKLTCRNDLKEWRTRIYKRDNYTCQHCGQKGGDLNCHHILPFAKIVKIVLNNGLNYPDARQLIKKFHTGQCGVTLCVGCHKQLHERLNNDRKL